LRLTEILIMTILVLLQRFWWDKSNDIKEGHQWWSE
jgi:hypothetical protein